MVQLCQKTRSDFWWTDADMGIIGLRYVHVLLWVRKNAWRIENDSGLFFVSVRACSAIFKLQQKISRWKSPLSYAPGFLLDIISRLIFFLPVDAADYAFEVFNVLICVVGYSYPPPFPFPPPPPSRRKTKSSASSANRNIIFSVIVYYLRLLCEARFFFLLGL